MRKLLFLATMFMATVGNSAQRVMDYLSVYSNPAFYGPSTTTITGNWNGLPAIWNRPTNSYGFYVGVANSDDSQYAALNFSLGVAGETPTDPGFRFLNNVGNILSYGGQFASGNYLQAHVPFYGTAGTFSTSLSVDGTGADRGLSVNSTGSGTSIGITEGITSGVSIFGTDGIVRFGDGASGAILDLIDGGGGVNVRLTSDAPTPGIHWSNGVDLTSIGITSDGSSMFFAATGGNLNFSASGGQADFTNCDLVVTNNLYGPSNYNSIDLTGGYMYLTGQYGVQASTDFIVTGKEWVNTTSTRAFTVGSSFGVTPAFTINATSASMSLGGISDGSYKFTLSGSARYGGMSVNPSLTDTSGTLYGVDISPSVSGTPTASRTVNGVRFNFNLANGDGNFNQTIYGGYFVGAITQAAGSTLWNSGKTHNITGIYAQANAQYFFGPAIASRVNAISGYFAQPANAATGASSVSLAAYFGYDVEMMTAAKFYVNGAVSPGFDYFVSPTPGRFEYWNMTQSGTSSYLPFAIGISSIQISTDTFHSVNAKDIYRSSTTFIQSVSPNTIGTYAQTSVNLVVNGSTNASVSSTGMLASTTTANRLYIDGTNSLHILMYRESSTDTLSIRNGANSGYAGIKASSATFSGVSTFTGGTRGHLGGAGYTGSIGLCSGDALTVEDGLITGYTPCP